MNAWAEVVRILAEDKELRELIIAPNAPMVSPRAEGCKVIGNSVFSAADVQETLTTAATHASGRRSGDQGQSGILCLGLQDVGRIHISYFMQRGSRVIRIVRVPFDVPTIDTVCANQMQVRELVQAIGALRHKTLLVYGSSHMANSQFIYAILDGLNNTHRQVIFIAERMLSFLLSHDNSIVIQVEVPIDAPSLEDAIQNAFLLEPDVAYLGDIRVADELPSLPELINAVPCTILSTVGDSPSLLLERLPKSLHQNLVERGTAMLLNVRTGDDDKLQVEIHPWPPLKEPK